MKRCARYALIGNAGTNHAVATVLSAETRFQWRSAPATNAAQNLAPTVVWTPGVSTAIAVPGLAELVVQTENRDGRVVSLELWNGSTKVGDIPVATGRTSVNFGATVTNDFRVVARDNLGGVGASSVLRVVDSLPPVVSQFTHPIIPAVLPEAAFDVAVIASDPDGQVQRVEYFLNSGADTWLVGVATNYPWTATVKGVAVATRVSAVAYDDHGIASAPAFLNLHLIGALGDDFYAPFPIGGAKVSEQRSNVGASTQAADPFPRGSGHSLWWRWTAPSNGVVAASTLGSAIDTFLGVYSWSFLPTQRLTALGTNNDSPGAAPAARVKFRANAGAAYLILVDSVYPEGGEVRLNLAYESVLPSAPTNDLLANRTVITQPFAGYAVDTAGATRETAEPLPASIAGGRSVWWEWHRGRDDGRLQNRHGSVRGHHQLQLRPAQPSRPRVQRHQ